MLGSIVDKYATTGHMSERGALPPPAAKLKAS
jgi:hypothetical protein